MARRTDNDQIRLANKRSIVDFVRVNSPVARIDMSAALGLSPAVITDITGELIRGGLAYEIKPESDSHTGRGRPRVALSLNPEAAYVIGVKVTINQIEIALGDYAGKMGHSELHVINAMEMDGAELTAALSGLIREFQTKHCQDHGRFMAIGVAVQGWVNPHLGEIVWSPALRARNIPLARDLAQEFGVNVHVSNDANAIAWAFKQQPDRGEIEDFAVIMLGYGVGMGMVLNNEVYDGYYGAAAEFGHTKYQADGPICNCGRRGCIEAHIGDYAIYRDAAHLLGLPPGEGIHPSEEVMQEIADKARKGNRRVQALFDHAGKVLGYGLSNVLAMLSPAKLIITGSGARAQDLMASAMEDALQEALVPELRKDTQVEFRDWDQDYTMSGVIQQAITTSDADLLQSMKKKSAA